MYKNVLQSIQNIEIWPVISFVIFFVFFLCLLLYVFTADKKYMHDMSVMPINDQQADITKANVKQ